VGGESPAEREKCPIDWQVAIEEKRGRWQDTFNKAIEGERESRSNDSPFGKKRGSEESPFDLREKKGQIALLQDA